MATLLLFAALAINLALSVESTVYHIKPTFGTSCPHIQCTTLDTIASNPNRFLIYQGYRRRNVSLMFLPGTHNLPKTIDTYQLFELDLKLKAFSGRVDINCENGAYIRLAGSGTVLFEGLQFSNCGGSDNHRYAPMRNTGVMVGFLGGVTISGCSFRETKDYYAFESYSRKTILLNSTFTNSVKVFSLGRKRSGNLTISNCVFQGQYSSEGGALHIENLFGANITHSTFKNSIGNSQGGGVYIKDSKVSFSSVLFQNNTAQYCAGVYIESSDVHMSRVLLSNNQANHQAALCAVSSVLRISNASITHNVARLNGTGGIVTVSSTLILDRVLFTENRGFYGGALYLSSSTLQANRTVFRGNQAALSGGALYAESSVAVFQNSMFRNNSDSLGKTVASVRSDITPSSVGGS